MAYEEEIAAKEKLIGPMDAHQREVFRNMCRKEDKFWERQQAFEEQGHSHSPVGEW